MAACLGEGNFEFKPVKLRIKINLMSHFVRAEGLGIYNRFVCYDINMTDIPVTVSI